MADGFVGTNEVRFDANEEWLYVMESNARRISRLRVQPDAVLFLASSMARLITGTSLLVDGGYTAQQPPCRIINSAINSTSCTVDGKSSPTQVRAGFSRCAARAHPCTRLLTQHYSWPG